jgi:hypothetical protein
VLGGGGQTIALIPAAVVVVVTVEATEGAAVALAVLLTSRSLDTNCKRISKSKTILQCTFLSYRASEHHIHGGDEY